MAEDVVERLFDANGDEVALDLVENHRRWIARLEAISDPQSRLLETLNWLANLAREHSFRQVDEDRAKLRSDWRRSIDEVRAIDRALADKMVQEGPPNDVRTPNYLASLKRDTVWYRDFCGVALRAIRQGGAAALDDALAPGTKRQAIELSRMVREAEQCAAHLGTCVVIRESSMGKELDQFAGFRDAFRAKWYELGAIMEQNGPAVGESETPIGPTAAADESGLALTLSQTRVLETMARFDASRLLSSKMIAEEMDVGVRLSEETVRLCVGKLIESHLAERPEGARSGARLNRAGRRLAGKIAG
jgi:hypothetical protein